MAKINKHIKLEHEHHNPVAKNAFKFNRAQVFRDKKQHYSRKAKHKATALSIKLLLNVFIESAISCVKNYQWYLLSVTAR